jgi:hypothetical protein
MALRICEVRVSDSCVRLPAMFLNQLSIEKVVPGLGFNYNCTQGHKHDLLPASMLDPQQLVA